MADPETKVKSRLFMDRGLELGNSEDRWIRRALHVLIGNKDADAVPVKIVDGSLESGTDHFIDVGPIATTAGTTQTLINYTVPVGKLLVLYQLQLSCRITSEYELYSDSNLIASGLLGAAHPTDNFPWQRHRDLTAGQVLKLEFTAATGETDRDVRAHVQAALFDA